MSDFDSDVVNERRAIVIEKDGDLPNADTAIDGESLTPRRRRLFPRGHRLAQTHGTKAKEAKRNKMKVAISKIPNIIQQ